jgi:hypothetical protein
MSSKLTNKALDLLIEQVLLEKKINLPVDVPIDQGLAKIRGSLGVEDGLKGDWKELLSFAGDDDALEFQDLKIAIEKDKKKWNEFVGYISNSDNYAQFTKDVIKLLSSPDINLKDLSIPVKADAKEALEQIKAEFAKYTARKGEQGVGTVELPYRSVSVDKNWKDGTDLSFKGIPQATISVFRKGLADAGGDFVQYFGNLAKLGEALSMVAGGGDSELKSGQFTNKAAATEFLKQMPADELFNTAALVKTLGTLAKEVQGASAGTIFETFLALMLGGGIIGGEGKATDVVAGNQGKRKFSAKNYEGSPGGSQAPANFIAELGSDENEIIWYICLVKMGEKESGATTITNFSRLDIYISGVQWNGRSRKKPSNYICYNTNRIAIGTLAKTSEGKWKVAWDNKPNFMIPISPSWADKGSIASFDKLFVDTIKVLGDDVKTAIKEMNVMLNQLSEQTKIYLADKSPDSAASIGKNYNGLKANITGGIGKIGTEDEQTKFTNQSKIQENKTKSLKDLDKLIEHVILNKMNK